MRRRPPASQRYCASFSTGGARRTRGGANFGTSPSPRSLTAEEFADWDERFGIPLQQLWGMTETCGLPLMSPLSGDRRLASIGRPVAGYEVVVRGTDGEPAPPGELGEITVRAEPGATVALGYYRDPEATAGLFREGWLQTGDMAYGRRERVLPLRRPPGRHHPPRRHELLGARSRGGRAAACRRRRRRRRPD